MTTDYAEFLDNKTNLAGEHGFEAVWMPDFLFPFQAHLDDSALRDGRRISAGPTSGGRIDEEA